MKFKFPLQKVLENRKLMEGIAQKNFQEALNYLNEATRALEEMKTKRSEAIRLMEAYIAKGVTPGPALGQANDFIKGQEIRIKNQLQKVQEAEKLVEEKREALRLSVREYKIMERVKEKKFEEFKYNLDLQEQKEMDEQSILRFKTVKEDKS